MSPLVTTARGDHVFVLDATSLLVAAAGVALALVALVARGRARRPPARGAVARDGLALLAFAGFAALAAAAGGALLPWAWSAFRHGACALDVFAGAGAIGSTLGALGGALVCAQALLGVRTRPSAPALGRALGLVGLLGALVAQSGTGLAIWLAATAAPQIVERDLDWIHAGERAVAHPRVEAPGDLGWSRPAPVALAPRAPGKVRLRASTRQGPLEVTRSWTLRARRALAHPTLPLRVGNRWRYRWEPVTELDRVTAGRRGEPPPDAPAPTIELAVTGTRVVRGVRQFRVERHGMGTADLRWLYPVDGRTYVMRAETRSADDRALDLPVPGGRGAYYLPPMPGVCRDVSRTGAPAPCRCDAPGPGSTQPSGGAAPAPGLDPLLRVFLLPFELLAWVSQRRSAGDPAPLPPPADVPPAEALFVLESTTLGTGPGVPSATAPAPRADASAEPPSCVVPPERGLCLVLGVESATRAPRLAERLVRTGISARPVHDDRVVLRTTAARAATLLGLRVHASAVAQAPCPGARCRTVVETMRPSRLLEGTTRVALDPDACGGDLEP